MKPIIGLFLILFLASCAAPPSPPASYFDVMTPSVSESAFPSVPQSNPAPENSLPQEDAQPGEMGELYFFLQPRQTGGQIELARVSGICVTDSAACPPLEKIALPFELNFTLNALSWSPDGRFAAFAYPDNPSGTPQKLFIFDPAANTWTPIAEFPYIDPPFWAPDGRMIAFRAQDGIGGEGVYLVESSGAGLRNISNALPAGGRPYIMDGWCRDGIIMRPALNTGDVYLVRADGTSAPMFSASLMKSQFVSAPDASLFAYDEYDSNTQKHALTVINPNGTNPLTLASFTGGSIYPIVWSPDSRQIVFNYNSYADGVPGAEVYAVKRDGSEITALYKGTTISRLLLSPDGKYLLVEETTSITGGHLFTANLATLEKNILQAPGLSTDYDWYAPSWRPGK